MTATTSMTTTVHRRLAAALATCLAMPCVVSAAWAQAPFAGMGYQVAHDKLRDLCRTPGYLQCLRLDTAACSAAVDKAITRGEPIAVAQLRQLPADLQGNPEMVNSTHLAATLGGMIGIAGPRASVCLPDPKTFRGG